MATLAELEAKHAEEIQACISETVKQINGCLSDAGDALERIEQWADEDRKTLEGHVKDIAGKLGFALTRGKSEGKKSGGKKSGGSPTKTEDKRKHLVEFFKGMKVGTSFKGPDITEHFRKMKSVSADKVNQQFYRPVFQELIDGGHVKETGKDGPATVYKLVKKPSA